jgi:uncharacterized protein DUF397
MKNLPENNWRKSSYSAQETDCVELRPDGAVRDSKNPDGPFLTMDLRATLAAVKDGRFDR